LTSGSRVNIRPASTNEIDAIKQIADAHRHELGFLRRPALLEAIERQELLVAQDSSGIVGFVEYRHRRDQQTTLYNLVVRPDHLRQGIGRALTLAMETEAQHRAKSWILLKCPEDLPANEFYASIGYEKIGVGAGKLRRLNIWRKNLD
jgi:ribosomal protein S18 acetylase RimI-like enzyme